jgi:hypothetical protein
MLQSIRRKRAAMAATGVAVLATAGGAFAYFTTSGSGPGSAGVGSSSNVTVAQVGTVSNLLPGSPAQAVDFSIDNGLSTPQYIHSVAVSISSITAPAAVGGLTCTGADFTIVQPTAINSDLAAGTTTFSPSGATIAMNDLATDQDGCKGATVNLAFAAS